MNRPNCIKFSQLPDGAYFYLAGCGDNHILQKTETRAARVVVDNSVLWVPGTQPVVRIVTTPTLIRGEFCAAKNDFSQQVKEAA